MARPTTTPCIFTDRVPTEFRKMIFSHVLIQPKPFVFTNTFPKNNIIDGKRKCRWVVSDHHREPSHPGEYWDEDRRVWCPTEPRVTALLQTCRAFYAEAADVFYSENSCWFRGTTEAMRVMEQFGSVKSAIRTIILDGYAKHSAARFWKSSVPLTNLRSVSIGHERLCQMQPPDAAPRLATLVRQMLPLVKVLTDSYARQRLPIRAVDVLEIRPAEHDCPFCCCKCGERSRGKGCRCPYTDEAVAAGQAELVENLRAALTEALAGGET
ncbi:hypothetical protein LTR95_002417 [Oleoguttula sp. CCFEE 5521]